MYWNDGLEENSQEIIPVMNICLKLGTLGILAILVGKYALIDSFLLCAIYILYFEAFKCSWSTSFGSALSLNIN